MRVELLYKIRCQVLGNACGARELTLEMAAAVAAASAWLQSAEGGDLGLASGVAGGLKLAGRVDFQGGSVRLFD